MIMMQCSKRNIDAKKYHCLGKGQVLVKHPRGDVKTGF